MILLNNPFNFFFNGLLLNLNY